VADAGGPERHVRALFDADDHRLSGISPEIADAALEAGTFVAPF
jgi:hypothetical protein